MNKSIVLAGLLLASTAAIADIKPFIGIDITKTDADNIGRITGQSGSITISGTTYSTGDSLSYTEEIKDTSPTFKLGAVIDETHRVYLRYQDFEEDSSGAKITTLNYEYMFGEDNDKYRPYLGVHAGHGKIEDDYVSGSGLVYGAQAGIIVPIAKGFEFEAGIAYTTSNIEYKGTTHWNGSYEFNDGTSFTATNAVIQDSGDFDKAVSMSMGINYKF